MISIYQCLARMALKRVENLTEKAGGDQPQDHSCLPAEGSIPAVLAVPAAVVGR